MDTLSKMKILEFNSSSSPTPDDKTFSFEPHEPIYLISWTRETEKLNEIQFDVFFQARKYRPVQNFSALYSKHSNTVKLAYGEIFLDPDEIHGHYIGTYLFNETVKWAKQFTDAKVDPIHIFDTDDNVARRRQFYKQFGLKIVEEGNSKAYTLEMNVKELKEKILTDEQVKEYEVMNFINDLLSDKKSKEREIDNLNRTINYYQKNYIPKDRPNFLVRMYYRYLR